MNEGFPEGFDLESLLAPFADSPAGPDLRQDTTPQSPYFRLRDARAEARAEEREADKESIDAEFPQQWRVVRQLALETIATRSKDLEIAAWLAEAALRLDKLRGFTAAARLMDGLVERFWESLHPPLDEEGLETRVAPVTGLNGSGGDGTLIQPLRKLVLFKRRDGTELKFWQYEQSAQAEALKEADRKHRHATGTPVFSDLEEDARAAAKRGELTTLYREADGALEAWRSLGARLDVVAGADSPPTGRVRDLLIQISKLAATYAPPPSPDLVDAAPPVSPSIIPDDTTPSSPARATADTSRAVTRDDMLRELARIADFFRRTEPHSPLAYTLEEAVRRGRMTWPELLQEVMPDPSARNEVLTKLGIKPAPEAE
jgi:type VI secretion system protein ImpA